MFKQTRYDYIEVENHLSIREESQEEDEMNIPCDESGLILTPAI